MFDIGWTELLVIGVVALVVVGPKDLPVMFKTFGRFMARARSMAREFTRAMESAADETGLKDVANDIKVATNPVSSGIDRLKHAADRFEKWEPGRPAAPTATPVAPVTAATATAAAASSAASAVPSEASAVASEASAAASVPSGEASAAAASSPLAGGSDPKAQA